MRYFGFILIFWALANSAWAHLGETDAELVTRFGQPTSRGRHSTSFEGRTYDLGPSLRFRQDDWIIVCDLVEDRCARLTYSKTGSWTEDQFLAVLNANSQGSKWTMTSSERSKKTSRTWKRADGTIALWVALGSFTISTPAYERAKTIAEAKAKSASGKIPKL